MSTSPNEEDEMSATNPRFQVRRPAGPNMRMVLDTWLGTESARFYQEAGDHPETAQLLAETRASELNLQSSDPLGFVEKLSAHITEVINGGTPGRETLEDVHAILDHYARQLRGTQVDLLDQTKLYAQAPWVNAHGAGA